MILSQFRGSFLIIRQGNRIVCSSNGRLDWALDKCMLNKTTLTSTKRKPEQRRFITRIWASEVALPWGSIVCNLSNGLRYELHLIVWKLTLYLYHAPIWQRACCLMSKSIVTPIGQSLLRPILSRSSKKTNILKINVLLIFVDTFHSKEG